jgi:hypothetical protein
MVGHVNARKLCQGRHGTGSKVARRLGCLYTCVCMYVCMYVYVCVRVCLRTCVLLFVCVHVLAVKVNLKSRKG